MRRRSWVLLVVALLVAVAVIGIAVLFNTDLGRFKSDIESYVSNRTELSFEINGELTGRIGPNTHIYATDVRFGHADGNPDSDHFRAAEIEFNLNLWSLFSGPVRLDDLRLVDARIVVAESDSVSRPVTAFSIGRTEVRNLSIRYGEGWFDQPLELMLARAEFVETDEDSLTLTVDGTLDQFDVNVDAEFGPLTSLDEGGPVDFEASANIGEARFSANGRVEQSDPIRGPDFRFNLSGPDLPQLLGELNTKSVPPGAFEISGRITGDQMPWKLTEVEGFVGDVSGNVEGTIGNDDLRLSGNITGPDADAFMNTWIRLGLPPAPFDIGGGVLFEFDGGAFRFADIGGRIGDTIDVEFGGLLGEFVRSPFDFSNLAMQARLSGPDLHELLSRVPEEIDLEGIAYEASGQIRRDGETIIGDEIDVKIGGSDYGGTVMYTPGEIPDVRADLQSERLDWYEAFGAPTSRRSDDEGPESIRLFDDFDLPVGNLARAVLDLRFQTNELVINDISASNVDVRLQVADGVLEVDPIDAVFFEGTVSGEMIIDQRGELPTVKADLQLRDIIWEPLEDDDGNPIDRPLFQGDARLSGSGNTAYEVLDTLTGSIKTEESAGLIESQPLKKLLAMVNPRSADDPYTQIECFVAEIDVNEGVATSRALALGTADTEMIARGSLDLSTEEIELRFRIGPTGRATSVGKIFSPLVMVKGKLLEPAVTFEPGNTAAALLTDGWSLVFNAFEELSKAQENICDASLRKAERREARQ